MSAPAPYRLGSLCSGYGGLEMALRLAGWPIELAFVADPDPAAAKVLAHHHPDVPNLGDISKVDWTQVEPVDLLAAGYPCQPFSAAGRRLGTADERHVWPHVAAAIGTLRPTLVLLENVRGHLTLGFDEVVRDLNWLGYDAVWVLVKASDVGAPHQRARLFVMGVSRGPFLCGRDHRRGGLHQHQQERREVHLLDQGGCRHDRQGQACPAGDAENVRREDRPETANPGEVARGDVLASQRLECCAVPATDPPVPHPQAGAGRPSTSVAGVHRDGAAGAWPPPLDARTPASSGDHEAADARLESSWSRAGGANAAGSDADGDLAVGRVLGAAGQPVRPGGVRGEPAALRGDDRRARLCPECLSAGTILAWPAADPPRFGHRDAGASGVGGVSAAAVAGGTQAGELTLLPTPNASRVANRVDTQLSGDGRDQPNKLGWAVASLLPTPNAALGRGAGMPSSETAGRRMYTEGRRFLDDAVALLPTPAAADSQRASHTYERGNPTLLGAAVLLPTPTAASTPKSKRALSASTDNGRRSGGGQSSPPGLDEVALLVSGVRPDNLPPDEELPPKTRALVESLLPTPTVADARGADASSEWSPGWPLSDIAYTDRWGEYAPAIARWEQVVGRRAPDPTEPGSKGQPRLSPRFVEWMQGLPDGYVTAVPGISRNEALKVLGNGVVPQQGSAAVNHLAAIAESVTAEEVAA